MQTDWLAFVRSSNEQAPTPATSTTMTNMSEPTWQLLNRGAHRYEDIHPRVPITRDALDAKCQQSKAFDQEWRDSHKAERPIQGSSLYVIQQTAALKRVATIAPLTLRVSTHKEAMDAWIALVGNNGPKLYDVAMLVCWFQAPLEAMLQLNGSSSAVMLNTMKTSVANVMKDVRSSPSGVRYNCPTPFRMDDEDPVEVEIGELSTPWAARQWEDMKAKAGGMVDKLNRQVQMAANVASKYLSMLMPFIEEVAGGNIRGGTIIGNDFRHMRKVVTYGTANNFHYNIFPAYRPVEAQVVHMDVQPDPRNDSAEVTAKLDAAKADPDAIQRFRDGMVFIIAIQTFFLLLLPDSVGWVMVAERHAEAVFGENPTAAQVAAYEAELGDMKPLKVHRVKVEAGSCVCIRGYLLHAGDEGQANTMSVRIHFYSSPGFKPGETTYVHGLGKLFCSNVMPTVKPRHGWPLVAEFEVYRDAMVKLPPYSPPLAAEHEKHYMQQWDAELPTQVITGLKQIAKAAARQAKVEAEAEQKVQEKAAKRARSVTEPPQHFEP
ncbi:hypothetical protein QJQ45_008330 [Haematococcus lacustris]|nr:hypothetical protein QJQ45_008330 [Haematococcus lacustris]